MICQTLIGPDKTTICGHSITQHEGDELGTSSTEPCTECPCRNFTREPVSEPYVAQLHSPAGGSGAPKPITEVHTPEEINEALRAEQVGGNDPSKCPTCGSNAPELHPVVQHEGEVQPCRDGFHNKCTCGRRPGRGHHKNCAGVIYRACFHPVLDEDFDEVPQLVSDAKIEREEAEREEESMAQHFKYEYKHDNSPGKTVVKWADKAMFTAEPIAADDGPKVYLLWMTPDPLGAIAAATNLFEGKVTRSLSEVTDEERHNAFEQISKTHLKAPFEFVQFHFLIEGVTRGFTHQMVRQRTATYVQESTRFAVKEDMPVGLPPSLVGTEATKPGQSFVRGPEDQRRRAKWDRAIRSVQRVYKDLVNDGMPAEDVRGLLPTNVLTRLHYRTDLRGLLEHGGNRLCTQAQFEWRLVFAKIVEAIRNYSERTWMNDQHLSNLRRWQFEKIADMFRPICYLTGKCEFRASFDRPCSIRDRVDANASISRPSSEWDKEHVADRTPNPVHEPHAVELNWPWAKRTEQRTDGNPMGKPLLPMIPAIQPEEWLLNPDAAR